MGITQEQFDILMKPLSGSRIARRQQGGKSLSYLEAWDVKAHLTRIFGFANWDSEMLDYHFVTERRYESKPDSNGEVKEMVEVLYSARMQLSVRDPEGNHLSRYSEAAVGSASGPASMLSEHHDNALKGAASDALKRCAINLGTQFGLSLYDDGRTTDVVRVVVGWKVTPPEVTEEQKKMLADKLGATEVTE